ncbi:MAG: hypothetical protein ACO3NK_10585 [Prochlorotrichaceae cyanobacterium]|jgi:hypothetical protein
MSVEEFSPILQELTRNPVAFLGGFAAGLLRLNLSEDPVKTWLNQQGVAPEASPSSDPKTGGSSNGPQSITID